VAAAAALKRLCHVDGARLHVAVLLAAVELVDGALGDHALDLAALGLGPAVAQRRSGAHLQHVGQACGHVGGRQALLGQRQHEGAVEEQLQRQAEGEVAHVQRQRLAVRLGALLAHVGGVRLGVGVDVEEWRRGEGEEEGEAGQRQKSQAGGCALVRER
jgi:hypothetical protein